MQRLERRHSIRVESTTRLSRWRECQGRTNISNARVCRSRTVEPHRQFRTYSKSSCPASGIFAENNSLVEIIATLWDIAASVWGCCEGEFVYDGPQRGKCGTVRIMLLSQLVYNTCEYSILTIFQIVLRKKHGGRETRESTTCSVCAQCSCMSNFGRLIT